MLQISEQLGQNERILLFTYGILKNHGETVVTNHVIDATMFDLGAFPAITELNTGMKVYGNIIEVTAEDIEYFDMVEGVPSLYRREVIETPVGNAFIYLYQDAIELGDLPQIENWGMKK